MSQQKRTDKAITWKAFYFVYGFAVMFCCCGFSPIIHFYGTDSAVFYCFGQAMSRGVVVYKEIFDHKGIWIYFFNCAGAFLDRFIPDWGMYIVETLLACSLLYISDRIIGLFVRDRISCVITTCLFYGFTLNYFTYQGGNFTETYALAFQMLSCFLMLKYYCSNTIDHPPAYMFIHGICSGICLLLRANLTAIWVPFGFVLAIRLIRSKRYRSFFINLTYLLSGIAVSFVLPFLYCLKNHCIEEMIFSTFTFNFSYVSAGGTWARLLLQVFVSGASMVLYLALAGIIIIIRKQSLSAEARVTAALCLLFVILATFMGKRAYGHYFQTLLPFTMPVFIQVGLFLQNKRDRRQRWYSNTAALLLLCVLLTLAGNLRLALKYLPVDTEYKHLYAALEQTEEFVNRDLEDNSLLSTGNLMQVYVVTGSMPHLKYLYIPGVAYQVFPEPIDQMYKEIISGRYRYIFGNRFYKGYWDIFPSVRDYGSDLNEYISENYRVDFADPKYGYVLFERK